MKWRATLKWEAIADFKHLRWMVFPALGIWGLMMILSLFVPPGLNVLWLLYLPIALTGGYLCIFYLFQSTDGYVQRWRVMEMQSGRPVYVFAIIRLLNNVIVSAMGFGFLFMGSIALYRLELTWIDFLPYLLMMDNVFHEFSLGSLLGIMYVLAILLPAWGILWNGAVYSINRRWVIAALGLWLFPVLLVVVPVFVTPEAGFYAQENPFFVDGRVGIAEALILTGLAISPIVSVSLGAWLLDKKADFN
ncbi:MAG: hypothetical protein FWB88_08570 [Defluviitaleaceae bacterium]|nr:hypothetical protein [Defluviitaleaceae bacterium]MCL2240696.1 hypothetical protein [Defluviitaleaceae bacterium]